MEGREKNVPNRLSRRKLLGIGVGAAALSLGGRSIQEMPVPEAEIKEVLPEYRITTHVIPHNEFTEEVQKQFRELNALPIRFESKSTSSDPRGMYINEDNFSYVISPIDPQNKESYDYTNGLGLVVIGKDKETGENISILTHHPARAVFDGLQRILPPTLRAFLSKAETGTIDAAIFGGVVDGPGSPSEQEYDFMSDFLRTQVKDVFHIEPTIPLFASRLNNVDALINTKERRLYIIQPPLYDRTVGYKHGLNARGNQAK